MGRVMRLASRVLFDVSMPREASEAGGLPSLSRRWPAPSMLDSPLMRPYILPLPSTSGLAEDYAVHCFSYFEIMYHVSMGELSLCA